MKRRRFLGSLFAAFAVTTGLARSKLDLVDDHDDGAVTIREYDYGHTMAVGCRHAGKEHLTLEHIKNLKATMDLHAINTPEIVVVGPGVYDLGLECGIFNSRYVLFRDERAVWVALRG